MAISAETKLVKAKQRIATLVAQGALHRADRARFIANVRSVVAGRGNLERELAGTHGTIKKLEQQLIRAGLTPLTQVS